LEPQRIGFSADIYSPLFPSFSVIVFPRRPLPMKILLLSSLLAVAAAPATFAQAPATVKTKIKPAGQPSVKTKTTQSKPTAAPEAAAETIFAPDAVVDAKANALTANMQQNLGLNPQQTEKLRVINRRAVEQVETGHLRYKSDPRKLAGIVESASSSRLSAIKDVLTPAQFAKYQRKREEKMGVPNAQGVQGNPAPGLGGGGAGDQ
jgi:hypothetical protein